MHTHRSTQHIPSSLLIEAALGFILLPLRLAHRLAQPSRRERNIRRRLGLH